MPPAQASEAFARRPDFRLNVLLAHPPQLAASSPADGGSPWDRAMIFNGEPLDPRTIDGMLDAVIEPAGKCPHSPMLQKRPIMRQNMNSQNEEIVLGGWGPAPKGRGSPF